MACFGCGIFSFSCDADCYCGVPTVQGQAEGKRESNRKQRNIVETCIILLYFISIYFYSFSDHQVIPLLVSFVFRDTVPGRGQATLEDSRDGLAVQLNGQSWQAGSEWKSRRWQRWHTFQQNLWPEKPGSLAFGERLLAAMADSEPRLFSDSLCGW